MQRDTALTVLRRHGPDVRLLDRVDAIGRVREAVRTMSVDALEA